MGSHLLDFNGFHDLLDLLDLLDLGRLSRATLEVKLRIALEGDEEDLLFEGQVDLGRVGGAVLVWRKGR